MTPRNQMGRGVFLFMRSDLTGQPLFRASHVIVVVPYGHGMVIVPGSC